jgi:hypothetical protein
VSHYVCLRTCFGMFSLVFPLCPFVMGTTQMARRIIFSQQFHSLKTYLHSAKKIKMHGNKIIKALARVISAAGTYSLSSLSWVRTRTAGEVLGEHPRDHGRHWSWGSRYQRCMVRLWRIPHWVAPVRRRGQVLPGTTRHICDVRRRQGMGRGR